MWKERVAAVQLARTPSAWRCGVDLLHNECWALRNKVMQASFRSLACGSRGWFASPDRVEYGRILFRYWGRRAGGCSLLWGSTIFRMACWHGKNIGVDGVGARRVGSWSRGRARPFYFIHLTRRLHLCVLEPSLSPPHAATVVVVGPA